MNNEKQLIRWEKHYSDGSIEYTDVESTKNFGDNLSCADGLIVSRSYIKMKPVNWHTLKQNSHKHGVMQGLPLLKQKLGQKCNYVKGHILHQRFKKVTVPVIEFNEMMEIIEAHFGSPTVGKAGGDASVSDGK